MGQKQRQKKSYIVKNKIGDYGISFMGKDLWLGYGRIVVMDGGIGMFDVYRTRGKVKI